MARPEKDGEIEILMSPALCGFSLRAERTTTNLKTCQQFLLRPTTGRSKHNPWSESSGHTNRKNIMKENTIVVPQAPALAGITIMADAAATRDILLTKVQCVTVVANVDQRDAAISFVKDAKAHIAQVEKDRVALTEPFLAIQRQIMSVAKAHVEKLKNAIIPVERMIGGFNDMLRVEAAAAERQRLAELQKIEDDRRKAAEEAQKAADAVEAAKTAKDRRAALVAQLEAEDAVIEANQQVQVAAAAPAVSADTSGGAQRYEITVEVLDIRALMAAQPSCVKLVPDIVEIKFLANRGVNLPGVTITKTPIFSVRK